MWIIVGTISIVAVIAVSLVSVFILKMKRRRARKKEELALQGISAGISARLHAVYPGSEWRWVCRPKNFVTNKGIARIEVSHNPNENNLLMDVCLNINGFMALHVLNVVDLAQMAADTEAVGMAATSMDFSFLVDGDEFISSVSPTSSPKPHDKETLTSWYNIVLIDKLTALIDDLHAKGEVCFFIGQDGRAYVENDDDVSIVSEFGEMPDMSLWEFITEKLSEAGLLAETQKDNCIFISWA